MCDAGGSGENGHGPPSRAKARLTPPRAEGPCGDGERALLWDTGNHKEVSCASSITRQHLWQHTSETGVTMVGTFAKGNLSDRVWSPVCYCPISALAVNTLDISLLRKQKG